MVAFGLLAALFLHPPAAPAQESLEQRYQTALKLFDNAQMEDACELFKQIEKEKPGYKETSMHLKPACDSALQAYSLEENLFKEGVRLLKEKRLDEAKQRFEQASKIRLKHPKYRTQCELYLKQIEGQMGEEALYQDAVRLFNDGKDAEASAKFTQIAHGGGARVADAETYLKRIQERSEASAWNQAVSLWAQHDYAGAKPLFGEVVQMKGKHAAEAQSYLSRISALVADQQVFEGAVRAYQERRFAEARVGFNQLSQKEGSAHAAEAQKYLQRIDQALTQEATARAEAEKKIEGGQDARQVFRQLVTQAQADMANRQYATALAMLKTAQSLQPTNREVQSLLGKGQELAAEEPLRKGLEAYFQGRFDDAERDLNEYLGNHGRKPGLAYFFRGAVYGSRYFLSGQQDTKEEQLALADFRAAQKTAPQFQPPKEYVSPKLMSLYSKAQENNTR